MSTIKRGDIIYVSETRIKPHGSVIYGDRPAIVVQNDVGNQHSDNLIVALMTSKIKRLDMPTHVLLQWYEGLWKRSMVEAEQIRTISKDDVVAVIDHLREEDIIRVDRALLASLAIGEVSVCRQ